LGFPDTYATQDEDRRPRLLRIVGGAVGALVLIILLLSTDHERVRPARSDDKVSAWKPANDTAASSPPCSTSMAMTSRLAVAAIAAVLAVYAAGYTRTRPTAPAPHALSAPPAPQTTSRWKDGSWRGRGSCPHGQIEATVTIKGGRIQSTVISQCRTRYSCDVSGELPPRVLQRQSAEVDYVSGATESTDAFYEALTEALTHASF
jgi:uncharacterized protein with FMN-binding domain